MRKIILVIVAVLTLGGILAGCSLPTAYPPNPNAEDHRGPDFTIWMRNIGYPCNPPLPPLTNGDRDWRSDIPAHACVFEYTWMFKLGWCYDRSLDLYGTAHTGAGNCTGKDESYWYRWTLAESQNNGQGSAFITWCLNHGGSCLPPNSPLRAQWDVRSAEIDTEEEILAADLALVEASPLSVYEEPGVQADDLTLDQRSQLYWDLGNVGAMDADEQAIVNALGDTSDLTVWRDDHRPSVVTPGAQYPVCTAAQSASLSSVFSADRPNCWKHTWQWHAGWCGPNRNPLKLSADFYANYLAWCPNGRWPLDRYLSTPLMAWDPALQWWKPTQAGQDWIDGKFQTGWLPVSPVGCSAC